MLQPSTLIYHLLKLILLFRRIIIVFLILKDVDVSRGGPSDEVSVLRKHNHIKYFLFLTTKILKLLNQECLLSQLVHRDHLPVPRYHHVCFDINF